MTQTQPTHAALDSTLLLPEGTRLVHIGPHKTGTTALQGALWNERENLRAQGVRHAGWSRNPANPVRAVAGRPSAYSDDTPPPIQQWHRLVGNISRSSEPRLVISSEFFAWAKPEVIRRIVDDLDPSRVHIAVTLRPIARIIPSMWQQDVQAGATTPFHTWLDSILHRPEGRPAIAFWTLERHDALIERWAEVVGRDRLTAIVVDDRDHEFAMRAFERLLGLREGTLKPEANWTNRSLTAQEAEAVRAFNLAFKAEGLPRALHARIMRFGAAQVMKQRAPGPDEFPIELPDWARERIGEIAKEMVSNIRASGTRVVGDLESLTEVAAPVTSSGGQGDREAPPLHVSPQVAGSIAIGVLVASGAARETGHGGGRFEFAEPVEVARLPTYQVVGVVGLRGKRWLLRKLARLRNRARAS